MTQLIDFADFPSRLNDSLDRVQLVLDREKAQGVQLAHEDCPHSYSDKFALLEQTSSCTILGILNTLQFLGLTDDQLARAKDWSRSSVVSLRLDTSSQCTYVREATRQESEPVGEVQVSLGLTTAKASTRVVTKITEYFYELKHRWRLCVVRGTGESEADDVMEIAGRQATQECVQRSKEFPYPETSTWSESCPMSFVLDWLSRGGSGWAVSVRIDRSAKTCYTPSRNEEVNGLLGALTRWQEWLWQALQRQSDTWEMHRSHYRGGHNRFDIHEVEQRSVFMPVQLLFRDPSQAAMSKPSASPTSMAPSGGVRYEAATSQSVVAMAAPAEAGSAALTAGDVNAFLDAQRQSLQSEAEALQELVPGAATTTDGLWSLGEARVVLALFHLQAMAEQYAAAVSAVEAMVRRQLVRAIGRELSPGDFAAYMRFHNRRLFRPAYRPQVWSVSVRRSGRHAPEGSVRIESRQLSGVALGGVRGADGFQPIETFCASREVRRSASGDGYTSIALSAATRVLVGGRRHVHGWLGHRFSGTDGAADLRLSVSARQFSSFIVLLGRMTSGSSFDAKHAFVVQNTEELLVPLTLETIPNAQQFREAISSLSPEQQRFAQAYRSMQLESTLFGICIIQVKPQLEKVLNLPPDALTKEIRLTQDLMKLFVQYQISADLLSYEPPPAATQASSVSTAAKVEAVRANVEKMLRLLEAMKEEEVRQQYVGGMKVTVKSLIGVTLTLTVDPFADLTVLKGMIRDREGIPVDNMRIIFAGQQLEDGRSLIDQDLDALPASAAPTADAAGLSEVKQLDKSNRKKRPRSEEQETNEARFDVSQVPKLLDDAFDRLDLDHAVRPAIIHLGDVWRHRKARPLAQRSHTGNGLEAGPEETVDGAAQTTLRQTAFDLLEALTRSGGLPCEDAELHVVVAATHVFDESVLETVVRRDMNPIEAVERSEVIMASVVHGQAGHRLIEGSEASRMQAVTSSASLLLGY
eukprot:gene15890-11374_t